MMQFTVEYGDGGGSKRDLIFRLKDGRTVRYYGIKPYLIVEKDGNALETGGVVYTVLVVKVTKNFPVVPTRGYQRQYLWLLEGTRHSYTTVFRGLIEQMVPGILGKTCYIRKLWVKKNVF